ncbi:MAG TPA: hypothetical protein VH308_03165 [Terracidiphilus sp.]|jgi:hypothetical protein|nr:hypothetical protein [Terracidiphilus sp.]
MSMKNLCMIGLAVLFVSHAPAMDGQTTGRNHSATQALPSANAQAEKQTDAVRVIDDPHTGNRWMLVRNPDHPGGPGRLVLAADTNGARHDKMADSTPAPAPRSSSTPERPVIHAGDKLVVEEHTAIVDARLEGMALSPAIRGAFLKVRLSIGGKVVRAEAVGPALAVLLPESEAGR